MARTRLWFLALLVLGLALSGRALSPDDRGGTVPPGVTAGGHAGDQAASATGPGPRDLLFRVDAAAAATAADGEGTPVAIHRQAAQDAARTGALAVELPDGTRYRVRHERSERAPDGNWTFIGRVDTPLGAQASVITFGPDGTFGLLPTPDGGMLKFTTRAGQAYLQPAGFDVPPGVDPSRYPDYVLPDPAGMPRPQAAAVRGARAPFGQLAEARAGPVTITILAVYTKNLTQLRGSRSAAETEYRNLVAVMNQAHIDSGTVARFEIAGFVEVDYPAGAWNQDARQDLIDDTLPDGTGLHALRDQKAADLVALIRPYTKGDLTCGISQFPGPDLQFHNLDRDTGFSVTAVESCTPLVFAHEIGHNLGLMHDRDTVAGPAGSTLRHGPFRFAFGHRQLGPPGFATVMAYDSESRPRIGLFSQPAALCNGVPCGDAALADNVRSINLIAPAIARFRDPPNRLSIDDRWAYEHGDEAYGTWYVNVTLSSPAPAGGITFDVVVEAGSAVLGADAEVEPGFQLQGMAIPAGWTYASIPVRVHSDAIAEGPETIGFRLQNVRGSATVLDDHATLTIVDYDDKVRVAGRVRFPAGAVAPDLVRILATSVNHGFRDQYEIWASAPDFAYSLDVPRGAFL
ncbi:MAG TPA: M12 family metallo-peptidase, partial [Vicinamibacterales bacterium]|nr:M12 family metallo-peptidase [Vicinamibacterales bacterium]